MEQQPPNAAPSRGHRVGLAAVKTAEKTVRIFTDIVFITILLLGLWYLADTIYVFYHSRTDVTMPFKPEGGDLSALQRELSEDAVGWITMDVTNIDYPVMQGADNYEYLNRDPYGEYSLAGSIFLDARNSADFSDDYSILYGHHMTGGYMFGALDRYEDATYFSEHLTGTLQTARGEFPVQAIAFRYTDVSNDLVFDPEQKAEELEELEAFMAEAETWRDTGEGRIVALTTCKSPTSTRRACLFVRVME